VSNFAFRISPMVCRNYSGVSARISIYKFEHLEVIIWVIWIIWIRPFEYLDISVYAYLDHVKLLTRMP